jgi:Alpha/beta hydrolase family
MTVPFRRDPVPSPAAREVLVEAGDTTLSGLIAEPIGGQPRALIVAVHGAGVHGGYYDATNAPGLSLLELGSRLGFTVCALDRPGVGISADLPADRLTYDAQASTLLDAIDALAADHPIGGGVLLVAHSMGLRLAWTMAGDPRGSGLLGLDGAGNGILFAVPTGSPGQWVRPQPTPEDRGMSWGPSILYPPGSFTRGVLPLVDQPFPTEAPSPAAAAAWLAMETLVDIAPRIRIPVRLTLGEHERYWRTDEEHLQALREAFSHLPSFSVEIEPRAGHNISLGWAARAYHLKLLAFAEACLLSRALG